MASKIIPVSLDAWFANTLGGAGNGKGARMGVGQGVGDWTYQNRFGIRIPRPAEMATIPSAAAITAFNVKLRVSNDNFGIGGAVKFYLERGTAAFTENIETRMGWVKNSGPLADWPGPARVTTNRGEYQGAPSNLDWIGVNLLAMAQEWYAHPEWTELVVVAVASNGAGGYDESNAARRCNFYTRESSSGAYGELVWSENQPPNIPIDLFPPEGSKIGSTAGTQATVSGRHTDPEGNAATYYEAAWYPTSATDAVPGTPTVDNVVAASTAHNATRGHTFQTLPARTAGKWRMRFFDGQWGPWSLLLGATTAYQPSVANPAVTPATLTPDFFDSLVSADLADNITAAEYLLYQDPAVGQTITKWSSGKQGIAGAPTRVQVAYGGTALLYGTSYRYKRRLWNRDDVPTTAESDWPQGAEDRYFVQSESVGPTITVGGIAAGTSVKQNTVTPTFTLSNPAGGNIDQAQVEYASPTGAVLLQPSVESFASAANRAIVTPAGIWDWGQEPMIRGRIRPTGNADLGPWSDWKRIHINAAPGSPFPVTVTTAGAVKQPDVPGYVVDAATPVVRFPFRDTDRDLGYTEAPSRREVEVRDLALAHVAGSPFIITTGITDDFTMPTIPAETILLVRANYDDNANVRSGFSDYLFVKRSASPTLTSVTPANAATVTDPTPTIAWQFNTTATDLQASYRLTAVVAGNLVYDSGTVISVFATGATVSQKIAAGLLPTGVTVTWTLLVTTVQGLTVTLTRTFTTSFTQPPVLTGLIVTPDADAKAMRIEVDPALLPAGEFERYIFQERVGDGEFRTIAELTEQRAPALRDYFGRTVVDGLGSPDYGPAYVLGGTAANFDVNEGLGKVTHAAANTNNWLEIPVSLLNQRFEGQISLSDFPYGAAPVAYVMVRYIDLNNTYAFVLNWLLTGTLQVDTYRIGGTGGLLLLNSTDTGIRPMAYDDFTRADGALLPRTAPSGHVWGTRGPYVADLVAEPRIVSNRLTQILPGSMYATQDHVTPPHIMRGQLSWEAGTVESVAAIFTSKIPFTSDPSDPASDVFHLQIGRDFYSLETRENWSAANPTPWYYLMQGSWPTMLADGTIYSVSLTVDGDTVTLIGPDGVPHTVTDPAVGRTHGRYVCWETTQYTASHYKQRWEWVRSEDAIAYKVEATGTAPNALRGKFWPAHSPEPAAWTYETGDTDAILGVASKVGLLLTTPTGVTSLPNTFTFDDLRVVDPTLPVPSYVHVGAAHNLETIIRVLVDNGWQASAPVEASALLPVLGFWRLGPDGTPVELLYVQVGDFSAEPPTESAEYHPLQADYKRVVTLATYGREWRTRLLIPPESASLYTLLEQDKKLGRRVLIKTPDGGVYYSKIRTLSKTLGEADFLNVDVSGTEIAEDF